MSTRLRMVKGASVLVFSQAIVAVATFLRNVTIARFVDAENYGIATTFALTISLVEMTSNLALDRVLVQDREGESDAMLASAHLLQFIKALLIAALLYVTAAPIATLFNLPHLIWAFQLTALVPLLHGLINYDYVARQRNLEFLPTALFDALPQLLTLLVAFAVVHVFADYRVMLAVILLQAALHVVISHIVARRPYRWHFDRILAQRKLSFGWPILVNGLLMFGIFQGDRLIIGSHYDMATLGWYSVAFSLCLVPSIIFAQLSGYLLMPILSRVRDAGHSGNVYYNVTLIACFSFAMFMVSFFAVAGAALISVSFGEHYLAAGSVIIWLGIMQALRVVRIAPTLIANSQARTRNGMYSNLVRSIALLLALAFAWHEMPVMWIAVSGIAGEIIALGMSVALLELGAAQAAFMRKFAYLGFFLALFTAGVIELGRHITPSQNLLDNLLLVAGGALLAFSLAVLLALLNREARAEVRQLIHGALGRSGAAENAGGS
ncbi:oligosaccharide flippase family protein [Microbulbifer sp. SAOS-129_SWC]|uniref:oligosaccharide flippase family protein n=1 Tax=Microbulbifer sp. SAOS-129_SWC TaxID=3145235 RepID=UPI003216D09B